MNKKAVRLLIVVFLVLIDQVTKLLVETSRPELDYGIFAIHSVHNTGASFGMLQDSNLLLMIISFLVLGALILLRRKLPKFYRFPVALVVAGIIGNLTDRVLRGFVVDFFDPVWFPAFNVADSCIVIGVIFLCFRILKTDSKQKVKPVKRKKKVKR